jgi:hypothetical protein
VNENTNHLRRPSPTRPPALIVRLELEQPARLTIDAASFEDERRVRAWFERSRALQRLVREIEAAA